jgi:hypothetical protein
VREAWAIPNRKERRQMQKKENAPPGGAGKLLLLWLLPLLYAPLAAAQEEPPVQVSATAEFGALGVPAHTIQFGKNGTEFDYVEEGGQDVLFFFSRYQMELELDRRHALTFLYQPLDLETAVLLDREVVVDEQVFPRDTPLNLRYGFSFYRMGYAYDLFGRYPQHELSLGGALQIRNATITFTSGDGELRRAKRDLGPVPLLRARGRYTLYRRWWLGAEIDGFYAPIKYLNGGATDVEGAIVDASLRAGYRVQTPMDVYLNLRYLAGGASGTSKGPEDRGDGYVNNWLHFLALSVGITFNPSLIETHEE